jgi:hypothetical protein
MTGSDTARETATGKALEMLSAFASVGARAFNKTILDIHGTEVEGLYRGNRSLEELRRTIARDLQDAERNQQSVVIRPLFKNPLLIQLDDLDATKAGQITPFAFILRALPATRPNARAGRDGRITKCALTERPKAPAATLNAALRILHGAAQRMNGDGAGKQSQAT